MDNDDMMNEFEDWISTRKLITKYNGRLKRLPNDMGYYDVRVNGHWVTWRHAVINERSKEPSGVYYE